MNQFSTLNISLGVKQTKPYEDSLVLMKIPYTVEFSQLVLFDICSVLFQFNSLHQIYT